MEDQVNRSGLCLCGCGQPTLVPDSTDRSRGRIKGQPMRYVHGHNVTKRLVVEYIVDDEGCWVWQGARNDRGYGQKWDGEKVVYAHRMYYEALVGPIPEGDELDHLCRNRACVNPAHLEPVTAAENTRRGLKTKLKHHEVETIRHLLAEGHSQSELGRVYGVDSSTIHRIASGKTWREGVE